MDANKNGTLDIVRNTLEYYEARAILAEKAKLRAEMARINAELKHIRRLSPDAVGLAKSDSENAPLDP
jgi:hypothetical protein